MSKKYIIANTPEGTYNVSNPIPLENFEEIWSNDNEQVATEETDPTVPSHVKAITPADIANWNDRSPAIHNHDERYFTETESDLRFAPISHTHSYDNYQSWNLKTNGIQRTTVQSGGTLDVVATNNITITYSAGGVITLNGAHNHDDLYYTKALSDDRFFNVTGDIVNGNSSFIGNTDYDGNVYFNTQNGLKGVYLSRYAQSAAEFVKMYLEDIVANFYYKNDERHARFKWTIDNTDTESNAGAQANLHTFEFLGNENGAYLFLNGQELIHAGNITNYQNFESPLTFVATGDATVSRTGNTITIGAVAGTGGDGNNYLTGVTGSANGTMTFARNGLASIAFTSAHTHLWADITDKPTTFTPSAHTHVKADITDFAHTHLWADITDKPTTFAPSAHTLGSHSDVTLSLIETGEVIKWDGTKFINNTLAEAGIAASNHLHTGVYENPLTFAATGNATVSRTGNTITIGATAGTGADGNNYLTGVTGSANGTMTFAQVGLADITFNSTHTHSYENPLTFAQTGSATVSRVGNTVTVGATDTNTTYSAGTGLTLTGTTFTPTFGTALNTVAHGNHLHTGVYENPLTFAATGAATVSRSGNTITVGATNTDTNTTYTAGTGLSLSGTVFSNSAPHIATNLSYTTAATTGTVNSSTGANVILPAATTALAGLMVATDKSKLDGITAGATSNSGTVTSVGMTVPVGLAITGSPITTSGTLALAFASGYSIPTTATVAANTAKVTNATHTGEVTGSGALTIAAGVVTAAKLAVTGNGTTVQYLRSDGDGTFTWATPTDTNTTYSAGTGLSLSGTTFTNTAPNIVSNLSITTSGTASTVANTSGTGFSLPIATTTIAGLINTGIQSFAGAKTFTTMVSSPDFGGTSDIRLKKNIQTLEPKEIQSAYKTFQFKNNEQTRVGVIAQELEAHHPEFIRTDDEGIKSVSYIDLHSAEIAYLKDKIEKLEALVNKLIK